MSKPRGSAHTTLTETARLIVNELKKQPGIKMIAPGEIRATGNRTTGKRFVTAVFTRAGLELIITGQSVQKIAVHTTDDPILIWQKLYCSKSLKAITFKDRKRKPGI